jgi:tetratricopeptide (TPR) repeat protein
LGSYANALRLFHLFRKESNFDAAQQCIQTCEHILAKHVHVPKLSLIAAHSDTESDASKWDLYPNRHHVLIHLARTLQERFDFAGDQSDQAMAIGYAQEAWDLCSTNDTVCPTTMVLYAHILGTHAEESNNFQDTQRAISICRGIIPLLHTSNHPLSISARVTLADVIYDSYWESGNVKELNESIGIYQTICSEIRSSKTHHHSDSYPVLLSKLGRRLESRYERSQNIADIKEGMSSCQEAVQLGSQIHLDRFSILWNSMTVLHAAYRRFGTHQTLDEALDLGRQACCGAHFQSYRRQDALLNATASLLTSRYQISRSSEHSADDMEEIIALSRKALYCAQLYSIDEYINAANLANRLSLRFSTSGDLASLEEAINVIQKTMHKFPEGHRERLLLSDMWSQTLGFRFQETRDICDLDQALQLRRHTIAVTQPSDRLYYRAALALVSHLCTRFEILHFPKDLEEAVSLAEQLLASAPISAVREPAIIHEASKALLLRGQYNRDLTDIDRVLREITESREKLLNSVYGPGSFRTLAMSHLAKFRLTRDSNQAVSAQRTILSILESVPRSHYERYECLVHIAEIFIESGTPFQDISVAFEYLTEALVDDRRDVRSKLRGAKHFLGIVETKHKDIFATQSQVSTQLLEIYTSAIALLPRIAFLGIHFHSRLQALAAGQATALTGASLAMNLSLPERALEILEQGRAVFWTHTLRLRSSFDSVPEDKRERLLALARKLEKVSNIVNVTGKTELIELETAERRKQSEEFNVLLEEVRSLPGLERFLLHDQYPALTKAAKGGPVVVLVSSALASHAIIMRPSGEAVGIPLDSVADAWLVESGSVWRSAMTEERSMVRDGRKMVKNVKARNPSGSKDEEILRKLWISVVKPVLVNLCLAVCN